MSAEIVHKHIILRIEANKPPTEDELKVWMVDLVDKIGMKIDYMVGNNGPTCVVIIETSHMACHVWTDVSPALIQLDVYTCGPFDPNAVLEHIKVWDPVKVEYKYLDREHELKEIDIK
jgi:S-adenosylmethionine/arginine decarboxylase-like enzyme